MGHGVSSGFYLKIRSNYEKSNLVDMLFEQDYVLPYQYLLYVCGNF